MGKNEFYLGIDVGSVSSNFILMDDNKNILEKIYLKTMGKPIEVIQKGLGMINEVINGNKISGVGTTGSGRLLASTIVGADIVKNEITAHAVASMLTNPDVQTVIEIGGQDSKIIIVRNGIVIDFAMNTVCAAGTGSFLDRQATRLNVPIQEFGKLALKSNTKVRIAGRCAVFAESDMVHKQQLGYKFEDIIWGLCRALVRNYINNVAKGKEIREPILFQGGVAANEGIKAAFEDYLNCEIAVPNYYDVMGAYGAALLAREKMKKFSQGTDFYGFENICSGEYDSTSFECNGCSNTCEIIEIEYDGKILSRWGDKCGKWNSIDSYQKENAGR